MVATTLDLSAIRTDATSYASTFRTLIGAGTGSGDALTSNPLSQFAATTLSQLNSVISDATLVDAALVATAIDTIAELNAIVGDATLLVDGGPLGTPSSGTLTNCTFPTLNQNTTGTAAGLSATLAVSSGGTGLTALGTGLQVLRTNAGATAMEWGTVSGGTITALNNQAENRLVTIGATTTELDGEANLTFDGTTLSIGTGGKLVSAAANTLSLRNGTNAQTQTWAASYTDASNYSRAKLAATTSAITLSADVLGTHSADNVDIVLTAAGTGSIKTTKGVDTLTFRATGSYTAEITTNNALTLYTAPNNQLILQSSSAVNGATFTRIGGTGSTGISLGYGVSDWTIAHADNLDTVAPGKIIIKSASCGSGSTTYIVGADTKIQAGSGASGSAGVASGGNIYLEPGIGYGTGVGGKVIITGRANNSVLTSTGYSLTGSDASSMIDLAGTWNTTGTPTAFVMNLTDTASNAASKFLDFKIGGTTKISISKLGGIGLFGVTPPAQAAHIANPTGGGTQDAEARTAINAILVVLENLGATATS